MDFPEENQVPEENQKQPESAELKLNETLNKSYKAAYGLWLLFGWFGAHRFYLGRWFSGVLYSISFGLFGLGWAFDFLYIPVMVRSARKKLAKEFEANPQLFVMEEEKLAPWAKNQSGLMTYLQFPARLLFFCFGPLLFVLIALFLNQVQLVLILIVILVGTGFLGSMKQFLHRHPGLERIPALDEAVNTLNELHNYYYQNKPRGFFYYLFYPFLGFPFMLISKSAREEFQLYTKLIKTVFLLSIVETMLSYPSLYPPHLTLEDALVVVLAQLLITFMLVIGYMMPMVTTSMSMNLSGKQSLLKILTGIALLTSIPACGYFYYEKATLDSISPLSSIRLGQRMEKESFRNELKEATEMFLFYHLRQANNLNSKVEFQEPLTEKYSRHVGGIAVEDEANAFKIIGFMDTSSPQTQGKWLGVYLQSTTGTIPKLLYLASSQGKFYSSWNLLPDSIKKHFLVKTEERPLDRPPSLIEEEKMADGYQ